MGKRKNKRPKIKEAPSVNRQPKLATGPSFYARKAAWRISHIETEAPYGWHEIDLQTFLYIKERLASFESMTWSEILISAKKQHHSVEVSKIAKTARERLEAINQDDIDDLVSLRLSATNRVWGIFEEGVLRLLWWDPNHEIYPSKKKNT